MCNLGKYPMSCLNKPLSISRHKTSKGFVNDSVLASQSTLNCPLNSCSFSSHFFSLVLGFIVMVGWISLIGREGTLAQVCFPEFGAVRKDAKFDMLQCRSFLITCPIHLSLIAPIKATKFCSRMEFTVCKFCTQI